MTAVGWFPDLGRESWSNGCFLISSPAATSHLSGNFGCILALWLNSLKWAVVNLKRNAPSFGQERTFPQFAS